MKIRFIIMSLVSMFLLGACSQYDDAWIKQEVESIDQRLSNLEKEVSSLNNQIANLQRLVNNQSEGLTIVSHKTMTDGTYRLTFSDGSYIDIPMGVNGKDGADGKDGVDGKDGADGKDGVDGKDGKDAPVIGVKKDTDGKYYWTITIDGTTTWLTGDKGERLPVTGSSTTTGGTDGKDGANGVDGITPFLSFDEEGYWMVSYDYGKTYTYLYDKNGNRVCALGKVVTVPGEGSGFSYVTEVKDMDDHISMVLYDGTTLDFLKYQALAIDFSEEPESNLYFNEETIKVHFVINGYDQYTYVETLDKGNARSSVKYTGGDRSHGTITISAAGVLGTDSKVIVLLYNRQQTITHTFSVYGADDDRIEHVVPEEIIEKMEPYIPIYRGINPPNIEGSFTIDPMEAVYCEDYPDHGGYAPGRVVTSEDIRFYNQDMKNNTVCYSNHSVSTDNYSNAVGAFISGEGNYFSVFFNTEGESAGAHVKTALVISGEKTAAGIKDLRYAFIMVDDGGDPNDRLMENGVFRVFMDSDELCKNKEWLWGSNNLVKVWNPMKIGTRKNDDNVLTPFSIVK